MIDEEVRKTYDAMVGACFCNLYTCGKEKKEIILRNFDKNNVNHLFLLEVAKIVKGCLAFDVKLEMPWWKFIKVKDHKKNGIKRIHPNKNRSEGIDINGFLKFIQEAYDESPAVWELIYHEYYGEDYMNYMNQKGES